MTPAPQDAFLPVEFDRAMIIGLPLIDDQHKSLVGSLNRLIADRRAGPESELFSDVLMQLGRDLAEHFEAEEDQFAALGIPGDEAAAHAAAHGEILAQYANLNLELMHPHSHSRHSLLVLLRGWIVDHIQLFDLGLRRYLRS